MFDFSMFDPTLASAPFGGFVRQGIGAIPGGSTALGVVDSANAARRGTTRRDATTDRGAADAAAPSPRPTGGVLAWLKRPAVLIAGGVAVVLLVVLFVFRRR